VQDNTITLKACVDGGNHGRLQARLVKGRDAEPESTLWTVMGYTTRSLDKDTKRAFLR